MSDLFDIAAQLEEDRVISEIFAWLFALFVVDPLNAEMRERLQATNLPAETLQQSQQCVSTHGSALMQKAGNDPVWATGTAFGVVTGFVSPAQLFDAKDPNCAALVRLFQAPAREDGEVG
jgi:hypothetical protein